MRVGPFVLTAFNLAVAFYFVTTLASLAGLLLGKQRGRWVVWASYGLMAIGFAAHTWLIGSRWIAGGHPPFSGLFDAVVFFSWSIVVVFIAAEGIFRTGWLAMFVGATEVVLFLYASDLDRAIQPLMPVLKSMWLNIHVVAYMIAYGTMALACFAAIAYYYLSLADKSPERVKRLDRITYRLVAFGFPLLTVGILTGAVWANRTWGRYWGWDPKETWSLISWIVFAVYLHLRFLLRQTSVTPERRRFLLNWMVMLGFGAIIFTFLLLKFLPSAKDSLHTYM
jgi:cytochrome c-type biogenesis protein CcsB